MARRHLNLNLPKPTSQKTTTPQKVDLVRIVFCCLLRLSSENKNTGKTTEIGSSANLKNPQIGPKRSRSHFGQTKRIVFSTSNFQLAILFGVDVVS